MPFLIGILAVVVIVIIWYISTSNSIKVLDLKVQEGESGIDVALTKRYDVLTKMLDAVKGYMTHEQKMLTEIVRLRSGMSMQEKNMANQQMDEMAKQINILAENYPELKSSNNFLELQRSITDVEEHLQAARRLYNANVNAYNAKIVVFPNSIVAGNMGAVTKVYFEAEESKRQDVQMTF
ncbi:MAG: LemA family protein [Lachnospiraceae bacterium]|nr:LemA family protein [Lachnospiraceae bacterium]